MLKTIWDKYKIFVLGATVAVIQAIVGLNQPDTKVQWFTIALAAVTALSAWAARNLRGQVMSIAGIIFGSATYILQAVQAHTPVDVQHIFFLALEQIGILLGGYAMPPLKPLTYETNKVIEQAKEVPPKPSTQAADSPVNKAL